jgi:hypothetical protein
VSKTNSQKSRQFECPKCKAPVGKRCYNLWRFYPGGKLRPEESRKRKIRGFNVRSGRKHPKASHSERIQLLCG